MNTGTSVNPMVEQNMTQAPYEMPVDEDGSSRRRKIVLFSVAGILVVLVAVGVFFGPRTLSSYYFSKGVAAFQSGDFDQARGSFEKVAAWNSGEPRVYYYLGEIALGKPAEPGKSPMYPHADYQVAASDLEKAISLGLDNGNEILYADALNDLGYSYYATQQYQKANDTYLKHIKVAPTQAYSSRYFVALSDVERFNKPQEALDVLLPALTASDSAFKEKTIFRVEALLARLFLFFGVMPKTEEYAQKAIESGAGQNGPEVELAHAILALAKGDKGDFKAAESEVALANNLHGSSYYDCYLAAAYGKGKDFTKAGDLIKKIPVADTYQFSVCQMLLVNMERILGKTDLAKKYGQYYMNNTDKFKEKNIFVVRNRADVAELLKTGE